MDAGGVSSLSHGERVRLAISRGVSEETQLALTRSDEFQVRTFLAMNPSVSRAAQRVLARDPEPRVQRNLARNPAFKPALNFPLPFLRQHYADFVSEALRTASLDGDTVAALLDTWTGTLTELISTAQELAPEDSPN